MMRRLTSAPKPRSRVSPVQAREVVRPGRPPAVAHAVVAGEVARRLGRRDEVVGRDRVLQVGKRRLDHRGAGRFERADRLARSGPSSPPSTPSARKPHGTPTRRPRASPASASAKSGTGSRRARGVRGSWPNRTGRDEGRVLDGADERADLVEGRGERHEPVAADPPVGRLEADHAAQGRRLTDRAARVGAERDGHHAARPPRPRTRRRSRPARGPGPTGCASSRTRCSRWTSPWRTRPCWSCRPRSRRAPRAARRRWRSKGGE